MGSLLTVYHFNLSCPEEARWLIITSSASEEKKKKTQTFYPRICEMMGKEKKKNRGEGKEEGVASCPTKRPEF